ncbi:hypothetical protein [Vibrio lentus]|nr:hypothetical protein [Vibrio lentus]
MSYEFEKYVSALAQSMYSGGKALTEIYQTLPLLEHSVIDGYLAGRD